MMSTRHFIQRNVPSLDRFTPSYVPFLSYNGIKYFVGANDIVGNNDVGALVGAKLVGDAEEGGSEVMLVGTTLVGSSEVGV